MRSTVEPLVRTRLGVPDVTLDADLDAFFADVGATGRQAALVTSPGSRLSPFVDHELRTAQVTWVLQDDDGGLRDAVTGARVAELRHATGPRAVHPRQRGEAGRDGLVVEAVVRFRATGGVLAGAVAERLAHTLEAGPLAAWGVLEPLTREWSTAALTAAARAAMPAPSLARAAGDAFAWVGVRRTPRGLSESTRLLVPPGALTGDPVDAVAAVADLLTRQFQVELATVFRHPISEDGWRRPGPVPAPAPLALVLGPRAVRALDLPATLPEGVESSWVGRQMLPSRLLRFADPLRAWHDFVALGLPAARAAEPGSGT